MGCAIAFAIGSARPSVRVVVLEKSLPGAEASSKAAGILGAELESHGGGPFLRLCIASRERFTKLAADLRDVTGIDVEFRPSGSMRVASTDAEEAELEETAKAHAAAGLVAMRLGRRELLTREPALGPSIRSGLVFERDARIDPPLYLRALRIAAERKGASFATGRAVKRVSIAADHVRGVELVEGSVLEAVRVIVAAGSPGRASSAASTRSSSRIRPARGLDHRAPRPRSRSRRSVIAGARTYLSPRDDGRVLVGSTLEFVGFEKLVTEGAARDLLAGAIDLVPALANAELSGAWSNFRPYTRDELPIIGKTRIEGLLVATGHYRNGILLSAITAEILCAIVLDEDVPLDLAPFSPERA